METQEKQIDPAAVGRRAVALFATGIPLLLLGTVFGIKVVSVLGAGAEVAALVLGGMSWGSRPGKVAVIGALALIALKLVPYILFLIG